MKQSGLHWKRRNDLYVWRSGACTGNEDELAGAREKGAKIRIVYSPADAEKYASEHPGEQVVFLSVGFETTTPAECLSVKRRRKTVL